MQREEPLHFVDTETVIAGTDTDSSRARQNQGSVSPKSLPLPIDGISKRSINESKDEMPPSKRRLMLKKAHRITLGSVAGTSGQVQMLRAGLPSYQTQGALKVPVNWPKSVTPEVTDASNANPVQSSCPPLPLAPSNHEVATPLLYSVVSTQPEMESGGTNSTASIKCDIPGNIMPVNATTTSSSGAVDLCTGTVPAIPLEPIGVHQREKGKADERNQQESIIKAPTICMPSADEEKKQACRDRNRIHARNTRMRKKAYVDGLKRSLDQMVEERRREEELKARQSKLLRQNRDVRYMVMQNFLHLQGNEDVANVGGLRLSQWETVIKEDITMLTSPCLNCKSEESMKVVTGLDEAKTHAADFVASLKEALGGTEMDIQFQCDRKSFMMDEASAMVNFAVVATIKTAVESIKNEMRIPGSLRAKFCQQTNKIQSARLLVDTGSIYRSLNHSQMKL